MGSPAGGAGAQAEGRAAAALAAAAPTAMLALARLWGQQPQERILLGRAQRSAAPPQRCACLSGALVLAAVSAAPSRHLQAALSCGGCFCKQIGRQKYEDWLICLSHTGALGAMVL
eukprot:TRINITY_DN5847_c2_g1_i1.p1 TRINITY_DN5847_c2_g1~~TRINITY_DN5847_c2_g1_i1.p1  ORF type:complete len:116 (+),score=20.47 TRINITY_DN5847_c2_g1_i1:26-373(+)